VNLEPRRRFRVPHFDLIPGDIVDPAGFFIDEVVMTIRVRIEEHRVGSEMQRPKQPPLNEEIERVVDTSNLGLCQNRLGKERESVRRRNAVLLVPGYVAARGISESAATD
jgi:hypothetical protein